jgi:hypothetical protein
VIKAFAFSMFKTRFHFSSLPRFYVLGLKESEKASQGYKAPTGALGIATSDNPFSYLYPRKSWVKR